MLVIKDEYIRSFVQEIGEITVMAQDNFQRAVT